MKKLLATFCAGMALCFLASCAEPQGEVKSYNQGINIIPTPQSLVQHDGFSVWVAIRPSQRQVLKLKLLPNSLRQR